MSIASVSHNHESGQLKIEFIYQNRKFLLERPSQDTVRQFIQRCEIKLSPSKKKQKQNQAAEDCEEQRAKIIRFLSPENVVLK